MATNETGSRVSRRSGTKSAMHKRCQQQTKGAAARARKTLPQFNTSRITLFDLPDQAASLMSKEQFDNMITALDKEIS